MSERAREPTAPGPKKHLAIAILLNSYRSPFISEIRESYVRSIGAVAPECTLSFFYPAEHVPGSQFRPGPGSDHHSDNDGPGCLPDPARFDLIVVGGGNADPRKTHGWILRVHRFIRDVAANYPATKLCGICWGHQTISMLFGGEIVDMGTPELGVTEAKLTPLGRRFLPRVGEGTGVVRLQQHHRRAVGRPPCGFYELLAGNQAFLSHNNAILTFQGHPEKDARAAKVRIRDAARWFGTDMTDPRAVTELVRQMEIQHDGLEVWKRVLQWAAEGAAQGLSR